MLRAPLARARVRLLLLGDGHGRRDRVADQGYPHFHARHADGSAKVRIDTVEVIESDLGRRQLRFVLAWAELHQDELIDNWRRARAGETLNEIEPL